MDIHQLFLAAVQYDTGDAKRIAHLLKVWGFAREIAHGEGVDSATMEIVEASAILHDIGIRNAEKIHGSNGGKYQEIEGPAVARELLAPFGVSEDFTKRVEYIIAHHHHYEETKDIALQILLEADFLVNSYEDSVSETGIRSFREKVFRTKTGRKLLDTIFAL